MSFTSASAAAGAALWRRENEQIFLDTIGTAAADLGIQPLAVEKDYWVCEALRAMSGANPDGLVFKGGTSLEKLRIIERFSEDLDLMVTTKFTSKNQGRDHFSDLCDVASTAVEHDELIDGEVRVFGKLGTLSRRQYLFPPIESTSQGGIADPGRIMIELHQSGGAHPTFTRPVDSLLARALRTANPSLAQYADVQPFVVQVLHPGRTLVEKLLRVNTFAQLSDGERDERGWPRVGRQFYDIWALLGREEVRTFLADRDGVRYVLDDCQEVSKSFWGDAPMPAGGFAESGVFTGQGVDMGRLRREHETAMRELYYGAAPGPSFDDVLARVEENRGLLNLWEVD